MDKSCINSQYFIHTLFISYFFCAFCQQSFSGVKSTKQTCHNRSNNLLNYLTFYFCKRKERSDERSYFYLLFCFRSNFLLHRLFCNQHLIRWYLFFRYLREQPVHFQYTWIHVRFRRRYYRITDRLAVSCSYLLLFRFLPVMLQYVEWKYQSLPERTV